MILLLYNLIYQLCYYIQLMFRKKNKTDKSENCAQTDVVSEANSNVKYPIPKILLIDIEKEIRKNLIAKGYNISIGSFGSPYNVVKSGYLLPVTDNSHLPFNYIDQDIVIIDLINGEQLGETPKELKQVVAGEKWAWSNCIKGVINPRPIGAYRSLDGFDKIYVNGGIFIIFACPRNIEKYIWGGIDNLNTVIVEDHISHSNWDFLSDNAYFGVQNNFGEEIEIIKPESMIGRLMLKYNNDSQYLCTIEHPSQEDFITLAVNRFGSIVAGVKSSKRAKGLIFIFPDIKDKSGFIIEMFDEVLPSIASKQFPYAQGFHWEHNPEYELQEVLKLNKQIEDIELDAKAKITSLEETIRQKQDDWGFLYDLIRETGDPLRIAVKQTLELLGFQQVIDMDVELDSEGKIGPKMEDLQIRNDSPLILVEIKGIVDLPSDEETLQVWKYLTPRIKELKRYDVRGLFIINHQKNIPPLERENKTLFREVIITNAIEHEIGLLTTWDLFRLLRGYINNKWNHKDIRNLLYNNGRIEPIPNHYHLIGTIEHIWDKEGIIIIGTEIKKSELKKGDFISIEHPIPHSALWTRDARIFHS